MEIIDKLKWKIALKIGGLQLRKSMRTPIADLAMTGAKDAEPRPPPINYHELMKLGKTQPLLVMIVRAIQQEVIGPGFYIAPRFKQKCSSCGEEYDKKVARCQYCKEETKLVAPDREQYKRLKELISRPNEDYSMEEMLNSIIFWDEIVGDYYISVVYGYTALQNGDVAKTPKNFYIEDARYILPVADDKGQLGNNEYFCEFCYSPDNDEVIWWDGKPELAPRCHLCNSPLKQTAYIQILEGKKAGRFGIDEMVHRSTSRIAPELFGTSRAYSLYTLLLTCEAMDRYNFQLYSEGKVGGVLNFEQYGPGTDVTDLKNQINDEMKRKSTDPKTGEAVHTNKIRVPVTSSKGELKFVKTMPDFTAMQSMEVYKNNRDLIGGVYGVNPIFVSQVESGKSGNNPRMQIDVQNRTSRSRAHFHSETFNEYVFPLLKITDWIIRFNPIEAENELLSAEVSNMQATAIDKFQRAGWNASIASDGTVVPSKPPDFNLQNFIDTPRDDHRKPATRRVDEDRFRTRFLKEDEEIKAFVGSFPPVTQDSIFELFNDAGRRLTGGDESAPVRRWVRDNLVRILSSEAQKENKPHDLTVLNEFPNLWNKFKKLSEEYGCQNS